MTRKQFVALIVALALLGAGGAWLAVSERSAWTSADPRLGQKLFSKLTLSEVAEISIRDHAAALTIVRSDGAWTVKERADFAADPDAVRDLLLKLVELKIVQIEPLGESRRPRLQLADPAAASGSGTAVELKDGGGKSLARMLLGKKVMARGGDAPPGREEGTATGRYVLPGTEAGSVVLVSDSLAQAEAKGETWLSKDLIRVDRAKSIWASGGDGNERFSMSRESESRDWKLLGAEKAENSKLQDVVGALLYIRLVDVVASPDPKETGLDRPIVVKVRTFDDLSYTINIGQKTADDKYYLGLDVTGEPARARVPAKGESAEDKQKQDNEFAERRAKLVEKRDRESALGRWTFLVAKSSVEALLRERAQFLPEKKPADGRAK